MSVVSIPAQNITNAVEVDKMKITLLNHILSQEVLVEACLQSSSSGLTPIVKYYLVAGEEYHQWGADDNYLIRLIAQKLNISLP
jgi:hypothetical protein